MPTATTVKAPGGAGDKPMEGVVDAKVQGAQAQSPPAAEEAKTTAGEAVVAEDTQPLPPEQIKQPPAPEAEAPPQGVAILT